MGVRRKVFLVRSGKTNTHSLLQVVPSDFASRIDGVLGMDVMNALVQWKNLDELVEVLGKTGPLIAFDVFEEARRLIPIVDAVEIAEAGGHGYASQGFVPNDKTLLRAQLYLDGYEGFYPSKASVARGIANHGLLESGAAEDLRAWANEDPGALVAFEPLADIVLMRNLCSVILRIIANRQNPDAGDVLEASGFMRVECEQGCRGELYVIPLHYDVDGDMTLNFSWKWGEGVFSYMLGDSLNQLIRRLRPAGDSRGFGNVANAISLASPGFSGRRRFGAADGLDCEGADTRIYLGIEDDVPQVEAAERFVYGVANMFACLKTTAGESVGWDFDGLPPLSGNGGPQPVFHSLASAMVGTLIYRMGVSPATCKNCGNGMLIRPKGKRREFCSDACRSRFSAGNASGNDWEPGRRKL